MSSDVIWHIRDKLWPMLKHGSIRKVYACLAVTCHLHFWQNDRDFLRATVVTRGWNGYRNKSQHRKSTLEKKILPPFQQGFEPATFQSRVQCSNHWAIPAPRHWYKLPLCIYMWLAQVPGKIKRSRDLRGGRWSWTLTFAQKRSWVGRWSWAEQVGRLLLWGCPSCSSTAVQRTLS